ncbi:MAG: TonB-dependent receptor [Alphaproteobacteria bacterium]|nr:TonB-dependent receptor [Alphaproteobacteria bacterium]MDE2630643.1 TonB-dependent receptor [Alphaproteobacteria bacterium]
MGRMKNFSSKCRRMSSLLLQGTAMAAVTALTVSAAYAQANGNTAGGNVETVVVTGTSIHGAAPVGQDLITVDRQAIENTGALTVQQLLTTIPTIQGFGNPGQGGFGSADASGTNAPTVHGLGASASNGTLVLIDGHRLPLSGLAHSLADPNMIPALGLERVEVLPDGDSSIYGSDAVAGVINFVTRKDFNGLETTAQGGFGDGYSAFEAGFVGGQTWSTGSVMAAYSYSDRSALSGASRPYYALNKTVYGGSNFASNNCGPAEVSTSPSAYYVSPYTGAPMSASAAKTCDYTAYSDILPSEVRNNVLVSLKQNIGSRLELTADLVYSVRLGNQRTQRGTVTATAFRPGSTPPNGAGSINPYFQGPPGATSETVLFDADALLGPGSSITNSGAQTVFGTLGAVYQVGGDWLVSLGATFGQDNSKAVVNGQLCGACTLLALNGTTSSSGSNAPTVLGGISTLVTQNLASPSAFVLDPWGNNTSAATKAFLIGQTRSATTQTLDDVTLKADGTLFSLPGGNVKAAFGAEGIRYGLDQWTTRPSSTSVSNVWLATHPTRQVEALFGEVRIPIIGEGFRLPLVQAFNFDASARYDHYSDFGGTTNPKFAVDWTVTDGLKLRASYGTSFTAPALTSHGDAHGITTESGFGNANGLFPNTLIPASFPGEAAWQASLPAGVQAAACTAAGCVVNNNNIPGTLITGGNAAIKPETGSSRSFGVDFDPPWLEGFHANVTYWIAKYTGLITAPTFANDVLTPGLYHKVTLGTAPGGAITAAQIAAATAGLLQTSPLPATSYFIFSYQQDNAYNIDSAGIDFNIQYNFTTDHAGAFTVGVSGSDKQRFKEAAYGGGSYVSYLNTNFNTTFSALALIARANFDWQFDPFAADVFVNYENPYKLINQPTSVYPTGVQHVGAFVTVDLHLSYDLPDGGWTQGTQLYFEGDNILDQAPPFYNVAAGFDATDASPIGRVLSFGVRKKW